MATLLLCACEQSNSDRISETVQDSAEPSIQLEEAEAKALIILSETGKATWVNWPTDLRFFGGTEISCLRVSEEALELSKELLSEVPASSVDAETHKRLTGKELTASSGTAFLLRGFATNNSMARVTVTGETVTVHSDALGGLFNIRRHPCVAILDRAPATVFTVVAYDL